MNRNGEEDTGNIWTEEMNTRIEDNIEHGAAERNGMCSETSIKATHSYRKNPAESQIGTAIDLRQWDTLVFKGLHEENGHGWLVEDRT